jgi:hypothetical protein
MSSVMFRVAYPLAMVFAGTYLKDFHAEFLKMKLKEFFYFCTSIIGNTDILKYEIPNHTG